MRFVALLSVLLGLGLAWPSDVASKLDGAAPGFAGDVLDGSQPRTCRTCHSGNPLNDASKGSLTITAPETVTPGETVTITVALDNQVSTTGTQGFQAILKDPATEAFVGAYTLTDPSGVKVVLSGANEYVTHTGPTPTSWTFDWTAPSADPPSEVVLYVAANAANGNSGTSGDYIYSATQTIALSAVSSEDGPAEAAAFDWSAPAPNPVQETARVTLTLSSPVSAEVYLADGRGRRIRDIASGSWPAGPTPLAVDVRGLPAGLYFLVAEASGTRRTQPLSVVR